MQILISRQRCQTGSEPQKLLESVAIPQVNVLDEVYNPNLREAIKTYSQWPTIPQVYMWKSPIDVLSLQCIAVLNGSGKPVFGASHPHCALVLCDDPYVLGQAACKSFLSCSSISTENLWVERTSLRR